MLLSLENVHSGYGKIRILHGVTLNVPKSKIVCIIGPNGSGKSTIFKAIFGLIVVEENGRIAFKDRDITNWKPNRIVRQGISYVPQARSIFRNLTVDENMAMGAYVRTDPDIQGDIDKAYERFPLLKKRRGVKASNLSGGEQRMLEMSRALLLNPELLLLDEPSLGLEPRFADLIFERIVAINKGGKSILIIEQNARRALKIADYAYVLDLGKVRFEGVASDIEANKEVQRLYLGG